MGDRVADPKALGYSAFAIMAWMASITEAGWYQANPGLLHAVAVFATFALLIAALASFLRGETWHAVFFMFWSAFVLSYQSILAMGMPKPTAYNAWYDISLALVSCFLFLVALRMRKAPVTLLNIAITLAFVGFALGGWTGAMFWMMVGGYLAMLSALAAFWAAADVFNGMGAAPAVSGGTSGPAR